MKRQLVIGDIHGRHKALIEVLKKSKFDYEKDELICLGDVTDGGYNTYEVVEELLKIKHLIFIMGNHDEWFVNHLSTGWAEKIWLNQGGANTLNSYGGKVIPGENIYCEPIKVDTRGVNVPVTHQEFFNTAVYYYISKKRCFVHAGLNPAIPEIKSQSRNDLIWDRNLIDYCKRGRKVKMYKEVFIGHSTTEMINGTMKPINYQNLWCIDTGAGWTGKLCIMEVETKKYWLSKIQEPAR